jgi:hypothetical protein
MLNQPKDNITKLHKDKLGMDVPEGFFAKSKEDILSKVIEPKKPKQTVFWLKPIFAYPIAASIVLAFALTFWMQNNHPKTNNQITDSEDIKLMDSSLFEGDFLVSSLLVPDSEVDEYLDHYIVNNVIVEAELSEEQFDNIFINSLFVEDSLLNNYLNESLIENIMI